jgi:hypothetical protein
MVKNTLSFINKHKYKLLLVLAVVLMTGFLIAKCARNKSTDKHTEVRLNIINKDILETTKADKYRKTIDSLKQIVYIASKQKEYVYLPIKIKSDSIVREYIKVPTPENCDNAVTVLRVRSNYADSLINDLKKINVYNDTLIASYKRTVVAKDQTIKELNKGYEDVINHLKQAKKPRRFGFGINAGYGATANKIPTPYIGVGISYNLVRF